MGEIGSLLGDAVPFTQRAQVSKAIFSLIEQVGQAKHGVVHVERETGQYQASTGAVELLCLTEASGSLSALQQHMDFSNSESTAFTNGVAVFFNEQGVPLRMRCLPSVGDEAIFFVEDVSVLHDKEMVFFDQGGDVLGLFENAPYGIYRSTLDGKPIRANPAMARMNGFETEAELMVALTGTAREWYVDPTRRDEFIQLLQRDGKVIDFVSEVRMQNVQQTMWVSETAWIIQDEKYGGSILEGTVIDANSRVQQEIAMRKAATTDVLSGLGNRLSFNTLLTEKIQASDAATLNFAVLLFDMDRFKDINDVFGHARGDMLIAAMAGRLKQKAPKGSFLSRLGGDEFAMVMECDGEGRGVDVFARELITEIEKPFHLDGSDHMVSTSIGFSFFPAHGNTASDLLKAADIALYYAKNTGRGKAEQYNDEHAKKKRQQAQLIADLRGADRRGELELYYQSVVDAKTGEMVGFEALMRWRHPVRGLVSPMEFIPAAEDAGFMIGFGNWAIDQACMHAKAMPEHLHIAVNVSAVQFYSADLPRVVREALKKHGIAPNRLELEVTESFILRNEAMTLGLLEELHEIGVRIALDDFGTGYSSLSYLQRFAFDKVKIDKSFIRSLKTNSVNTAIVRAVLSIGRDLGLSVVAEGIETESERNALLHEGCPFFQGYLYSKPLPFDTVSANLQIDILKALRLASDQEIMIAEASSKASDTVKSA
jgi:diguanylate cyclase (GGDEF)-like protein